MGWTPSQFINLPEKDRAFVIASILTKIEEEKKQNQKAKARSPRVRRR
jgi:hypothetical protein